MAVTLKKFVLKPKYTKAFILISNITEILLLHLYQDHSLMGSELPKLQSFKSSCCAAAAWVRFGQYRSPKFFLHSHNVLKHQILLMPLKQRRTGNCGRSCMPASLEVIVKKKKKQCEKKYRFATCSMPNYTDYTMQIQFVKHKCK